MSAVGSVRARSPRPSRSVSSVTSAGSHPLRFDRPRSAEPWATAPGFLGALGGRFAPGPGSWVMFNRSPEMGLRASQPPLGGRFA